SVIWHFIGTLQKNKVKYAVRCAEFIHSVDSLELLYEINKKASSLDKIQKILFEVKTSDEETKSGIESEEEVFKLAEEATKLSNVKVIGLMTISPLTEDEKLIRKSFSYLRDLKEKLNKLEKIADIEKNINELEKKFEEQVKQLQNYEENLMQIKTKVGNFDKLFEEMGYVRSKIEETQKELANIMKFPERITESEEKEKQEIEELKEKLIDTEMITQQKINEIIESDKRTQNQLFDLMKMPEKIAQIRTKEDAEIESIKESEKQIETKISEILEKEKRKVRNEFENA
ncbi:MAG: alanine racemase, partial [Candidatus Diapherotrites archaeon]